MIIRFDKNKLDTIFGLVLFIIVLFSFNFYPDYFVTMCFISLGLLFIIRFKFNYFNLILILLICLVFILGINFHYYYSFKNTLNFIVLFLGLFGWNIFLRHYNYNAYIPIIGLRNIILVCIVMIIPEIYEKLSIISIDQLNGIFSYFASTYNINAYKHTLSIILIMLVMASWHNIFINKTDSIQKIISIFSLIIFIPFLLSSKSVLFGMILLILFYNVKKYYNNKILNVLIMFFIQVSIFTTSLYLEYKDLDGFRDIMYSASSTFSLNNFLGCGSFAGTEYLKNGFYSDLSLVQTESLKKMWTLNYFGFESSYFLIIFNHGFIFGNFVFLIFFIILENIKYSNSLLEFMIVNTMKVSFFASFFSNHLFQPYFYGTLLLYLYIKNSSYNTNKTLQNHLS